MAKSKILLVDDEVELTMAMQIRLELAGFEVSCAKDGQEALEKTRSIPPDLIILDIMLPKMDGFKVCRILKFDEKYKKIPVIMLTARAQDSDKQTGYDVGADAYIMKPFDHEVVMAKIKELLKK